MTQREHRIFVYKPPQPEVSDRQPPDERPARPLRAWLFSPLGMLCSWMLAFGLLIPVAILILVTLREPYVVLLFGFGLWLSLGLIVIHWWIPSASGDHPKSEGIAAAGWHIALTLAATCVVGWLVLFRDGFSPLFTLADTRPVVVAAGAFTAFFGVLVLWARGHSAERTARYTVVSASILAAWMSLWLVAAHGGL